jgi:hypothetical protein
VSIDKEVFEVNWRDFVNPQISELYSVLNADNHLYSHPRDSAMVKRHLFSKKLKKMVLMSGNFCLGALLIGASHEDTNRQHKSGNILNQFNNTPLSNGDEEKN